MTEVRRTGSRVAEVRRAGPQDAEELVRLRGIMLADLANGIGPDDGRWRDAATETLRARLGETGPTMAAFVVDQPDRAGVLAACAVGVIDQRLGGPGNPLGRTGYVFSVVTEPDLRRRGYSRRCVTALLEWYREQGIPAVDLRASAEGESLYRDLGFRPAEHLAMRLRLPENPG
jgi:GNAT superfamily N-acetyltransferase